MYKTLHYSHNNKHYIHMGLEHECMYMYKIIVWNIKVYLCVICEPAMD